MNDKDRIAIGYIRVSTEEQAAEGVSLDAQRAKIAALCELHGLQLAEIEADEGISGKSMLNRPGLSRAIQRVVDCKGVLVVYSLSRMARNTRDAIDISERLARSGADLVSISEKIDTTSAMGRFVFTLMAALGQLERDQIAERTTAALGYKRAMNELIGSVPYGFTLDEDGVHLKACEEEQAVICRIVTMSRQDHSLRMIAAWLNADKVPTKNGRPWSHSTIQRIVAREVE